MMTPFKLALRVSKFVASLVLLLVVIPGAIYYGGLFATSEVLEWRAAHKKFTQPDGVTDSKDDALLRKYGAVPVGFDPNDLGMTPGYTDAAPPSCAEYYRLHKLTGNFGEYTIIGVKKCHL